MSIQVTSLTKVYGTQHAVDHVSFEVHSGEIVGFLGPNGAGKSTTMKILTGYIPPSSGNATVCGYDIIKNSIEIRKNIGYLPENNPLYLDMYVKEYLSFVAGIYKVQNKKSRIEEMIELTGLTLERKKRIGQLSKGYRQRVGLAQAIIHDPKVLVLDEPTSGLDPNQLVEIRNVIKQIGKEKTVVLSTHIMQEVQAICDRVIIINHGKIVADKPIAEIYNTEKEKQFLLIEFAEKANANELKTIHSSIESVNKIDENKWHIISSEDIRIAVSNFAKEKGLTILTIQKEEQNLEKVFQNLTKKQD